MRIYSMTATFGKLNNETLTLVPGLNIVKAPNEWGKSTWCAFLVNMLYGINTREKAGTANLVDKERYAPWSGSPMSGRIDLCWNGRDITIERRTKGRSIFGDFNAYETQTGIPVPELTAENCGQMLLGVERDVFVRAGFLRLKDLPVTPNDALRRRLNDLVTTGDESGTGDELGKTLKDLKNKCRYNQSGLLPQAENEREQLRHQIETIHTLHAQAETIRTRQTQLEQQIADLENHKIALEYAESQTRAQRAAQALDTQKQAQEKLDTLTQQAEGMPSAQDAQSALHSARQLQAHWLGLQQRPVPEKPEKPAVPAFYEGVNDPVDGAKADYEAQKQLESAKKRQARLLWLCLPAVAVILVVCTLLHLQGGSQIPWPLIGGAVALIGVIVTMCLSAAVAKRRANALQVLYDRHPGLSPDTWVSHAAAYAQERSAYENAMEGYTQQISARQKELDALDKAVAELTGGEPLEAYQSQLEHILSHWQELHAAQRELNLSTERVRDMQATTKETPAPQRQDTLTLTERETDTQLENARFEQKQLQLKLGQSMGQADALGQQTVLKARLDTLNRRISRLEDTYHALELAQNALRNAAATLQRRFAPKIAKRAQALFEKLTDGKYQRVVLGEDLSMSASAQEETTMYAAQWRSDGTVDQLYLALRLAVAGELTPKAPLVLDDALVRFDDERLKRALEILQEEAQEKQVLLFTCQSREEAMLEP